MNTINQTIKYKLTYSKKTVSFWDVQVYLSESKKLRPKLDKIPTDRIVLLHFHSHYPLGYKEGFFNNRHSDTTWLSWKVRSHLTRSSQQPNTHSACTYPIHLLIKNIKKPSSAPVVACYLNGHQIHNQVLSPLSPLHRKMKFSIKNFFSKCDQILNGKLHFFVQYTLFSDIDKSFLSTIHKNWHIVFFFHPLLFTYTSKQYENTITRYIFSIACYLVPHIY